MTLEVKMKKLSRLRSLGNDSKRGEVVVVVEVVVAVAAVVAWWAMRRSDDADEKSGDIESMEAKGTSKKISCAVGL